MWNCAIQLLLSIWDEAYLTFTNVIIQWNWEYVYFSKVHILYTLPNVYNECTTFAFMLDINKKYPCMVIFPFPRLDLDMLSDLQLFKVCL